MFEPALVAEELFLCSVLHPRFYPLTMCILASDLCGHSYCKGLCRCIASLWTGNTCMLRRLGVACRDVLLVVALIMKSLECKISAGGHVVEGVTCFPMRMGPSRRAHARGEPSTEVMRFLVGSPRKTSGARYPPQPELEGTLSRFKTGGPETLALAKPITYLRYQRLWTHCTSTSILHLIMTTVNTCRTGVHHNHFPSKFTIKPIGSSV